MRYTRSALAILGVAVLTAASMSLSAEHGQAQRRAQAYMPMSGTYELDTTRGDLPQRVVDDATRNSPRGQRDRAYQSLLGRLEPPDTLAIDRNGQTVTISSSNGPRATFDADGRTRNEQARNRRVTATRAEFIGDRLSISSRGNRDTDFFVTFEPLDNGDSLLVTRQLDSQDLQRPVTIRSYYRRVASDPQWDLYTPETRYDPRSAPRAFVLPDGTRIDAVLDTSINTRTSQDGERFSMTVDGPAEYRDARIDGRIERITPAGQGRNAEVRVNFDSIRLPNGQTAGLEAALNTVRTPSGATLRVDSESGVSGSSRTGATIQHGAVGATLGAIIGAIAGGGKGAAIGAVVGGAGGVILAQDRDPYLDLPPGTRVTLTVIGRRFE